MVMWLAQVSGDTRKAGRKESAVPGRVGEENIHLLAK